MSDGSEHEEEGVEEVEHTCELAGLGFWELPIYYMEQYIGSVKLYSNGIIEGGMDVMWAVETFFGVYESGKYDALHFEPRFNPNWKEQQNG